MPLWLSELLRDPGLGLTLVAGESGLDRRGPIRWAHISDTPDPTPWLEGGELLLTTGLGIKDDPALQRRLVANLDRQDVVAIGFGVGVAVDEVPDALQVEAEKRELPLFTVPYEVPFIAVTRRVARATFEEHYATLRGAVDVHRQVLSSVVGGGGVPGVLDVVAKQLPDAAMVVFDYFGQVLEERDPGQLMTDVTTATLWEAAHADSARRSGGEITEVDGLCVHVSAVRLGEQVEAYLVVASESSLLEHEHLLAEQALTGLSLQMARDLSTRESRRVRVTEVLEDIASGHVSRELVRRQLARFGADGDAPFQAVSLAASGSSRRLAALVEEALDGRTPLVGRLDGHATALVQPPEDDHGRLLEAARSRGFDDVRIGVSGPHTLHDLRTALRESAVALARARPGTMVDVAELGVSGVLAGLADDEGAASFVKRVLGPLLEHERDEGTPLVDTLQAYLRHGCRPGPAAEELGVHRHTLTYRLERIRDLTGRDPRDGEHLLGYTLALELLSQRPDLK